MLKALNNFFSSKISLFCNFVQAQASEKTILGFLNFGEI